MAPVVGGQILRGVGIHILGPLCGDVQFSQPPAVGVDFERFGSSVGIGYDDDPTRAIEIIDGILAANDDVLRYPDRSVTVSEFGDSAIVLRVAYHIDTRTTDIFKIGSDVLTEIWSQFRAEGITIPYPQRSLHFAEPDGTMQKTLQVAG